MANNKGFAFTVFAILGALTGYATYIASKNGFSEETIDKYDTVLNKAKNVGTDLKRTYTSIGDKDKFESSSMNLGKSVKKLASDASELVISATGDMYEHAKKDMQKTIDNFNKEQKKSSKPKATKVKAKKATKKKSSK